MDMTQKVNQMYQQYPFPGNVKYKLNYGLLIMQFFCKVASYHQKSFLENANIMEVGCGTGNTLIKLAKNYPLSTFTGVDMVEKSLEIAQKNAEGLNNITFIKRDILELDLKQKFDVIFCIGVLHHLADIKNGFENIIKHIRKKGGYLVLWLYGKYGRFRLNLNQMMLEILFGNRPLQEKVDLTKKLLKKTKHKNIECHFNVPNAEIEDNWEKSLEFVLNNDVWLVDQFLHYNEKTVSMHEILTLTKGLDINWLGVSKDIKRYIDDKRIAEIYNKLSDTDKLLVLDYLLKPNYYLIVIKK